MLDGLKGEDSIAELCRRESIAQSLCYSWSNEFLEAGKKRLAGDAIGRFLRKLGFTYKKRRWLRPSDTAPRESVRPFVYD